MASAHGDLRHLLPGNYKRHITAWLEEDCPSLDYGGFVVGESEGEARLLGKSKVPPFAQNQLTKSNNQQGIVAGIPFFDEVFSQLGCTYVTPIRLPKPNLTRPGSNGTSKKAKQSPQFNTAPRSADQSARSFSVNASP